MAEGKMAPLVSSAKAAGGVSSEVTFEMLRQLNDDVAMLTPQQLCGFLVAVQKACPEAVNDVNLGQDIDINLDELDMPAFVKVDTYVANAVGRKKKRGA